MVNLDEMVEVALKQDEDFKKQAESINPLVSDIKFFRHETSRA